VRELFLGHAAIGEALDAARRGFKSALQGAGAGPNGNAFTIAGTELRVDQVRGIASMVGGAAGWTERNGKQLIRNDTPLGRTFLAYVVGSGRYLTADDVELLLAKIAQGDLRGTREPDVAQFVNMAVAEPLHDPRTERPIWVTAAHKLASGHGDDYFTQEIPGLVTCYDPLHAEIPAGAQFADGLRPESCRPLEPTLEQYKTRLSTEVGPDGETYVREHLLSRVDKALS
jgi:hypothetical protein